MPPCWRVNSCTRVASCRLRYTSTYSDPCFCSESVHCLLPSSPPPPGDQAPIWRGFCFILLLSSGRSQVILVELICPLGYTLYCSYNFYSYSPLQMPFWCILLRKQTFPTQGWSSFLFLCCLNCIPVPQCLFFCLKLIRIPDSLLLCRFKPSLFTTISQDYGE
jgi:hypothetical protein